MKKIFNKSAQALHYLINRLGPKHRVVLHLISQQIKGPDGLLWPEGDESIQQILARNSDYCYSHITTAVRELQYWGLISPVMDKNEQGKFIRGFDVTGWKSDAYKHWAVQQLLSQPYSENQPELSVKRDADWNQQLNFLYLKDAEEAEVVE